ncbi:hypothetical protein MRB53_022532 [Persea americana]|uniref:Uncharacterized protein n=1 Tax=Persea americana TaxID=3435 RepID=A0ACC2L6Z9_PERAE|nr:hypothetical protein MRB53_022532 [Persea americana]
MNELIGRIPVELGSLSRLRTLYVARNNLTGSIPASFGNLSSLTHFSVRANELEGNIPEELGHIRNLYFFYISSNKLSGTIPPTLYNLSSTHVFCVTQNQLSGSLPPDLGVTLPNLVVFFGGGNRFTGPVPISLSNASRLERLGLSGNRFAGSIPTNLGRLREGNFFQGASPSLSALKGMLRMDVSHNNFSGQILDYLEKLRHLQYLNLSSNDFEGKVPQEGIFKSASAISIIGNKKLCGRSPVLLLPKCPSEDGKKQSQHFLEKQMIAILIDSVICAVLLLFLLYNYCIRKSKKHPHPHSITHPLEEQLTKISYGDLCKATDGFSSANLIGVGSYESVYKGYLDHIMKIVAVKVLNLQRQGASKSFIVECKALKNIRHRNLLKVLTVYSSIDFKGDDFKALVFAYMANGNLEQALHKCMDEQHQSKNLTLIQRLNITVDVAFALNYLHTCCEKPIVHCDLKPSNILLDDDINAHVICIWVQLLSRPSIYFRRKPDES